MKNPKSTVTHIANIKEDGSLWSVRDMLADAIEEVENGKRKDKKAIVIFLDDEEKYDIGFNQAGMKASEMIVLLEITKDIIKEYIFPK